MIIGSLPVMRGAYDAGVTYYRDNQVTMYGSTFQSLADGNVGFPPAELRADGKVYAINADKWIITANAIEAYNAGERVAALEETFQQTENPELVYAVTDASDRVLLGLTAEGRPYFPKNETYRVESNAEWLAVWLDATGHVLFGIRQDGSTYVAKSEFQDTLSRIEALLKESGVDGTDLKAAIAALQADVAPLAETFGFISNEEWAHAVVDAEGRLLFGIKADTGEVIMPKQDTYRVESNAEWLAVWLDTAGHVLFGVKHDGTFYAAKHEFGGGSDVEAEIAAINESLAQLGTDLKALQETVASLETGNEALEMLQVTDDPEGRTELTLDAEGKVLGYRDKNGVRHEERMAVNKLSQNGKEINIDDLATKDETQPSGIEISELSGVQEHSLVNLFNKNGIRTYDSEFADKVFAAIGRKTAETGCYSNNIECKEGDWFTRSDFGTGIVVVLDEDENVLGDVANAAYQPTIQITPSDPSKYDFSTAKYVVFVVMLANLDSERIVKAKYIPTDEGDYLTIPRLKVLPDNMDKDVQVYFKSTSGRYYTLNIDDSGESLILSPVALEGIPTSELPSDFPTFKVLGDFSSYYDGLVFSPVEGGVTNYLYELAPTGLVKRYIKKKVNCPRVLFENGVWYYYGVDGNLNYTSGKLNIFKANGETFELVKGDLGTSDGEELEPHDCLVISVNPLHYICQQYVPDSVTMVDGEPKIVNALHVEEIYEGASVWKWRSEDYPELWYDAVEPAENADYLHNNTICLDSSGNLCLNNKNADQILVIARTWDDEAHTGNIGEILWKIGGRTNAQSYDVPNRIKAIPNTQQWSGCHDTIVSPTGLWTMFNNLWPQSNVMEFTVNTEEKALANFKNYKWNEYRGLYMGSADRLAEGIYLVSWGSQRSGDAANAGIYDFINKKKIFEIRFDNTGSSAYRVYGIPKSE